MVRRNKQPTKPRTVRPTSIEIHEPELSQLREMNAVLNHYRRLVGMLERGMFEATRGVPGVDLDNEEWELDLDKGELIRGTNTQQQ